MAPANAWVIWVSSASMSGGASEGGPRIVSLHALWDQEATPQLRAGTDDVMADVRLGVEGIIRSAFTRSGRFMATFHHNPRSVPGSPAYDRFMDAVDPNRGTLPTVSLAIHCTPRENVDSIFEHGLRCSQSGTMGPGAYLAFGLEDVADYRCGRAGAVIVCLCAMHDPKAYTLVPAANTVMRQGYVILRDVSHHIVLGVAYSGPVERPLSTDPARGTRVEWWAEVAAGKWVIVCHAANQCFYPVGMGHHRMPCIAVVLCC